MTCSSVSSTSKTTCSSSSSSSTSKPTWSITSEGSLFGDSSDSSCDVISNVLNTVRMNYTDLKNAFQQECDANGVDSTKASQLWSKVGVSISDNVSNCSDDTWKALVTAEQKDAVSGNDDDTNLKNACSKLGLDYKATSSFMDALEDQKAKDDMKRYGTSSKSTTSTSKSTTPTSESTSSASSGSTTSISNTINSASSGSTTSTNSNTAGSSSNIITGSTQYPIVRTLNQLETSTTNVTDPNAFLTEDNLGDTATDIANTANQNAQKLKDTFFQDCQKNNVDSTSAQVLWAQIGNTITDGTMDRKDVSWIGLIMQRKKDISTGNNQKAFVQEYCSNNGLNFKSSNVFLNSLGKIKDSQGKSLGLTA